MARIINLTGKPTSRAQRDAGVINLDPCSRKRLKDLLQVQPGIDTRQRAAAVASMARWSGCQVAMIDEMCFFGPDLIQALNAVGIRVIHS